MGAFRRHDTDLAEVAAQGVQQLGALADQQIARLEQLEGGLALHRLHRNQPHLRLAHRAGDGLGIGRIVLVARHKRLHPPRRDQPRVMTQPVQRVARMERSVIRVLVSGVGRSRISLRSIRATRFNSFFKTVLPSASKP
jgi:hypothetical protein